MRALNAGELSAQLEDLVSRIRQVLSPCAVYLFGSYAYGTPRPDSDLDLLVVVEQSTLNSYERDAIAYRALGDAPIAIDIQVYTRREFEDRATLPTSFERTVKTKGRLIYAS